MQSLQRVNAIYNAQGHSRGKQFSNYRRSGLRETFSPFYEQFYIQGEALAMCHSGARLDLKCALANEPNRDIAAGCHLVAGAQ